MTAPAGGDPIWRPHARFRAHTPTRPAFRCRTCGAPWPCQSARLALLLAYRDNPLGLFTYLATALHRARHDLPNRDSAELAVRFLGWVPRTLEARGR
ncbi:flavin reductase [Plantactinospora sp. B6F1]|uniref:flavin reductase n=1 Tax=Plantactinospora sp. B6F1 TaxID=3158971 RepID=UPI0010DE151B